MAKIPEPTTWRRTILCVAPALMLACACVPSGAQAQPLYSIDFHAFGSAASMSANGCFWLSGSISDPAPGYSANGTYTLYAGFWAAAPGVGVDEVFFYGFEEC